MSTDKGEAKEVVRTLSSHSSMETDAAPQQTRGSQQRMPPHEHNVQLPDVPYDEVRVPRAVGMTPAYSLATIIISAAAPQPMDWWDAPNILLISNMP
jgi:hypothetical protein